MISASVDMEGGRVSCRVNELKAEFRHCWLPTGANKLVHWEADLNLIYLHDTNIFTL